jgi:hypothetical protein
MKVLNMKTKVKGKYPRQRQMKMGTIEQAR